MWLLNRRMSGHCARPVVVNWSRAAASDEGFGPRGNVHTWTWTAAMRCVPAAELVFSPLDEELELLPGELSATLAFGERGAQLAWQQLEFFIQGGKDQLRSWHTPHSCGPSPGVHVAARAESFVAGGRAAPVDHHRPGTVAAHPTVEQPHRLQIGR